MATVGPLVVLLFLRPRATETWGSTSLRETGPLLSLLLTNTRYIVLIGNFPLPLVFDFCEHTGRWFSFV